MQDLWSSLPLFHRLLKEIIVDTSRMWRAKLLAILDLYPDANIITEHL